jgi:hypothetical protein
VCGAKEAAGGKLSKYSDKLGRIKACRRENAFTLSAIILASDYPFREKNFSHARLRKKVK